MATLGDENVGRFDVTMNDALGVSGIESVGDLDGDIEKAVQFEWLAGDEMLQCDSIEEFHDDEGFAVRLSDVIDSANVGVVQGGSGLRFPFEAGERQRIFGDLVGQELESDAAMKAGIIGFVNNAHTATAESFNDTVMGNGLSYEGVRVRHRW